MCVVNLGVELREERLERDGGSQRSFTECERRADATLGQMVASRDSWIMSVSAALHAEG